MVSGLSESEKLIIAVLNREKSDVKLYGSNLTG